MDDQLDTKVSVSQTDLLSIKDDLERAFAAAERNLDFFRDKRVMAAADGAR